MSRAEKLLARMRASKSDWSAEEVLSVYRWAGFSVKPGAKHDLVRHDRYPHLIATVARSRVLPTGYIDDLLDLVDELRALEGDD